LAKRRKGKWKPVKHPGSLKRFGYTTTESAIKRHRALEKAVKHYGYKKTVQKLAFLKGAARIPERDKMHVSADLKWLKKRKTFIYVERKKKRG